MRDDALGLIVGSSAHPGSQVVQVEAKEADVTEVSLGALAPSAVFYLADTAQVVVDEVESRWVIHPKRAFLLVVACPTVLAPDRR